MEVRSRVGAVTVQAEMTDALMPGVVSLPHGFGHGKAGVRLAVAAAHAGVSLNDLTDPAISDELTGNTAASGVPVTVTGGAGGGGERGGLSRKVKLGRADFQLRLYSFTWIQVFFAMLLPAAPLLACQEYRLSRRKRGRPAEVQEC